MLVAGWEVRIVENCDRGLENAADDFQARGHCFSQYGPILSRTITYLPFFSSSKLAYKWVCLRNFVIELAYAPPTKLKKPDERMSE